MSKQLQVPGVGTIGLGVFIVVFVLLMIVGYSFLAALVFAVVVAAAAAIFFLVGRDRAGSKVGTGTSQTSSTSPSSAPSAAGSAAATPTASRKQAPAASEPATPGALSAFAPPASEPDAAPATPASGAEFAEPREPERLDAARESGADDLKRIKGIGPKIEDALNVAGIYHLDQIASWGAAEVAWMDEHLEDFRGRVTRDDWVGQARQLASGGGTAFSRRVDEGDVYD